MLSLFTKKRYRFTYSYHKKGLIYFNDVFAKNEADAVAQFLRCQPYFGVYYKLEVIE